MPSRFPKLSDTTDPRMFFLDDLNRFFNINKPLLRQYISAGYFKPQMESRGPGTPNLFNRYGLIRVGFIVSLAEWMSWKNAAFIMNDVVDQYDLQEFLWDEKRYFCIIAYNDGSFGKPFSIDSLEHEGELEDFSDNEKTLIILDGHKVLQAIEEKL